MQLRSDAIKVGAARAPHRSLLKADGITDEEMGRPLIAVVNSRNDIIPGHNNLDKIAATRFAESGSPAYELVKNFKWTNDDQNLVAKYIAQDKMTPEAAAKKWVDANQDKVKAWL